MHYLLILLAVSLLVSAVGWKYFIYFFSLGYGFGISALAIATALIFHDVLSAPTVALCAAMFVFGFRLANAADGVAVNDLWAWIGFAMIVLGTCLEAGADAQKNAAKKKNPKRFVDTGLYRFPV